MKRRFDAVFIGLCAAALLAGTSTAAGTDSQSEQQAAWNFTHHRAGPLVQAVRDATYRYRDVSRAEMDGYVPVLGCVSGPDMGAMGAHYLKASLLGDGVVDVAHPELLVYEPLGNGRMRLVAAEYLAIAEAWDGTHTDGSPPTLMGQLFDYSEGPNRFRLPAHYSLHVWAWKHNPVGVFSMWNPRVSCARYTEL
ncbi:hypothetical protein [Frateuria sp. STR12]|uniref:hypothetical protein n=1 Tax=Frateuria hangzhouensis TaxID=2995589 RepID=UPI002260AB95|nr:hypothetical protein [Frateuria sp. STR12]MCX7514905.1 hypothetical protein [Frateuria sp. STR12]